MMRRMRLGFAIFGVAYIVLLAGCQVLSQSPSVPQKHPEELAGWTRVDCLECHSDISEGTLKPYASFRHSTAFVRYHGMYSRQGQNLCQSCHGASFCQDCHARKEELKPSTRMGDRPDLTLPHRGDYIAMHQLDGKMDPGSCFACHGNKNDTRCSACHR
jgi:hypothetical protein